MLRHDLINKSLFYKHCYTIHIILLQIWWYKTLVLFYNFQFKYSTKVCDKVITIIAGYTNQIAECYDKDESTPLTERYPCPCTHYTPAPLDEWSDCMLDASEVADDITATILPNDYVVKISGKGRVLRYWKEEYR